MKSKVLVVTNYKYHAALWGIILTRVLPETFLAQYRITVYLGRKQTFCHKTFGTIPYYDLGAQTTAPNFGFLTKLRIGTFVFSCLF